MVRVEKGWVEHEFVLFIICHIATWNKVAKWVNIQQDTSVSDATIWSITLDLSIMILEVSFTVIYDVCSTGITYDDHQLTVIIGL